MAFLPDLDRPFVLLDDASSPSGHVTLFSDPLRMIEAETLADVVPALDAVREATRAGAHAAGFVSYDAGAAFDPAMPVTPSQGPLLWFGIFEAPRTLPSHRFAELLPGGDAVFDLGPLLPGTTEGQHAERIAALLDLIQAGDLYQANLTFAANMQFHGDPLALYARLRQRQRAPYGAILSTGTGLIFSFSPELFFTLKRRDIACRPMKGTAERHLDPDADAEAARSLAADPKQRAENLMIVDLMRNDLSRVAAAGSVQVPQLFAVETYPTVHQMVSAVTARRREDVDAFDILAALFPCGSITGAPKIRAAQVIAHLEDRPRGVYTGSIGHFAPNGDASFNVAIRTLTFAPKDARLTIGLGSGIVADSDPLAEWKECLTKARFLG
ncbi:aminodeoxychorismate synthase component I [Sphingobium agri]|uniref:Aminodeoxychorismate synthase component I n=1 Tax=Sphingobium agri TaxID=2933566 RepID=A0ABT0E094_9SPHN|nr:aminodeoxychorismate synthase component I [Sphingobium agri]MCK0532780.1 aminodeoxychorismate synthase component I [Sphingobium agri]